MNKTLIIIGREFTTRVRKRSFLVLTLVVPILLAGFYAFLMWMLLKDDTQDRKIAVISLYSRLHSSKSTTIHSNT